MAKLTDAVLPAAGAGIKDLIKDSSDVVLKKERVMLIGPPGHGKTTTALTFSKYIPEGFPTVQPAEPVVAKDMMVIMLDPSGMDCIHGTNVSVPLVIDLSNHSGVTLKTKLMEAAAYAADLALKGEIEGVILDGLTAQDSALVCMLTKAGKEKWSLQSALLVEHSDLFHAFKSIPCHVIYTCHIKAKFLPDDTAETKSKSDIAKQAAGVNGADIMMALTGQQITTFYRGACSLVLPVVRTGNHPKFKFTVHPYGAYGIEGKCRFNWLGSEEPAHLGKLFDKIKAGPRR